MNIPSNNSKKWLIPLGFIITVLILIVNIYYTVIPENYILIFVQVFNIYILYHVTSIANNISNNAFKTETEYKKVVMKPTISISLNRSKKWIREEYNTWELTNASDFPATNVLVKYFKSDKESPWVASNSIPGKQSVELFWVFGAAKILVYYCDANQEHYYMSQTERCLIKQEPISHEEYLKAEKEALDNWVNISVLHDKTMNGYPTFSAYINANLLKPLSN